MPWALLCCASSPPALSLLWPSCSSARSFAYGFLQVGPRGPTLAFGWWLLHSAPPTGDFHPLSSTPIAGRTQGAALDGRRAQAPCQCTPASLAPPALPRPASFLPARRPQVNAEPLDRFRLLPAPLVDSVPLSSAPIGIGGGGWPPRPSHTTGRAGPHPAVRKVEVTSLVVGGPCGRRVQAGVRC
jgi:hypothetical protein